MSLLHDDGKLDELFEGGSPYTGITAGQYAKRYARLLKRHLQRRPYRFWAEAAGSLPVDLERSVLGRDVQIELEILSITDGDVYLYLCVTVEPTLAELLSIGLRHISDDLGSWAYDFHVTNSE